MRTALLALVLSLAAPTVALAKPHAQTSDVRSAQSAASKARAELKAAKAAAKLAAHRVRIAKARAAALKANRRLAREQWIADCIDERTGPTGAISAEDAADICTAEAPDASELE